MTAGLLYVFWHWRRPTVDRAEYEACQLAFHAALSMHAPVGFLRSDRAALSGAPWANGGDAAYEDRYLLEDSCALDALDGSVASGPPQEAHAGAAAGAAGGTAGLYRIRLGTSLAAPARAAWFSKPEGMSYAEVFGSIRPLIREGESALLMRRMVLGPTPEFCFQSITPTELPPRFRPLELVLSPL